VKRDDGVEQFPDRSVREREMRPVGWATGRTVAFVVAG
jgi:hypothetical protein